MNQSKELVQSGANSSIRRSHYESSYIATIQCLILGYSFSGKTTYVEYLRDGVFQEAREKTKLPKNYTIILNTNRGLLRFIIKDTAGGNITQNYITSCYDNCDYVLLMFDMTCYKSFFFLNAYMKQFETFTKQVPKIVIGNKLDCQTRIVGVSTAMYFVNKHNLPYFEISVRFAYNIMKPFLWMARYYMDDSDLHFMPSTTPSRTPYPILSPYCTEQKEKFLSARGTPLPTNYNRDFEANHFLKPKKNVESVEGKPKRSVHFLLSSES